MKPESELKRHRWYHHWFRRFMGTWHEQFLTSENQIIAMNRKVFYCPLCREEYTEGGPIDAAIKEHEKKRKPQLSAVPPADVIPIDPTKIGKNPDGP